MFVKSIPTNALSHPTTWQETRWNSMRDTTRVVEVKRNILFGTCMLLLAVSSPWKKKTEAEGAVLAVR
jgi:hypothetical protein